MNHRVLCLSAIVALAFAVTCARGEDQKQNYLPVITRALSKGAGPDLQSHSGQVREIEIMTWEA